MRSIILFVYNEEFCNFVYVISSDEFNTEIKVIGGILIKVIHEEAEAVWTLMETCPPNCVDISMTVYQKI